MTEKKKRTPTPETKIHLRKDMYFLVTPESFDLYHKTENSKSFRSIGYFTNMEHLLETATQVILANMRGEGDFTTFIKMWRSVFAELTQLIKENNL
jgi:hypothetical protein